MKKKNKGSLAREKTHLKKKESLPSFVGSPEFWVDLAG
jgi:hypothetical protein